MIARVSCVVLLGLVVELTLIGVYEYRLAAVAAILTSAVILVLVWGEGEPR